MPNADSFFSPRAVQGGQLGTRQGFLHFGMHAACGRGDQARARAAERDRGRSADHQRSQSDAANAVMGTCIVPEEGSTLPAWAVFLSQNLRIHAVVS